MQYTVKHACMGWPYPVPHGSSVTFSCTTNSTMALIKCVGSDEITLETLTGVISVSSLNNGDDAVYRLDCIEHSNEDFVVTGGVV